jgi:hypothetical protein
MALAGTPGTTALAAVKNSCTDFVLAMEGTLSARVF